MKIPPDTLIARLRAAQGDPDTAQLLEAAANRLEEMEAQLAAPVRIDMERMQAALDSESIMVPAGLTRVEKAAFILNSTQPAQGERQPEEPKWYEKCSAPAYCAAQGKCDCGIAYRRHRA